MNVKRAIIAVIWGGLIGSLTFVIEDLVGRVITIPLLVLIFSGLMGVWRSLEMFTLFR